MKRVEFMNEGVIDIEAVKTMGVSVKDSDNAIGYFGTGLKFAIATIIRNGGSVSIWAGRQEYVFGTVEIDIRGRVFNQITINGEPMGITDQLGRNWVPWMAYRELACNAFDEGGKVSEKLFARKPGRTVVVVDCEAISVAHKARDSFLIDPSEKPIFKKYQVEVYPSADGREYLFYRGIRVSSSSFRSKFRYNALKEIDLTEDRTARYNYQLRDPIAAMWLRCEDKDLLTEVLSADDSFLEHDLEWDNCGSLNKPGPVWLKVVSDLARRNVRVSASVDAAFQKATKRSAILPESSIELRPDQNAALDKAVDMLKRAGYPVDEFPIIISDRLGSGILGRAACNRIYIALDAFTKGDSTLAGTLLEEWIHLSQSVRDHSRAMQNFLVDAVIDQANRADYAEANLKGCLI